eukprot:scaffold1549_cov350-Prasinococcus_capsulatus_cf.AAC.19
MSTSECSTQYAGTVREPHLIRRCEQCVGDATLSRAPSTADAVHVILQPAIKHDITLRLHDGAANASFALSLACIS